MKILYVIPFYHPARQFGGIVELAKTLAEVMAKAGCCVRVISTDLGIQGEVPTGTWIDLDGYQVLYGKTRFYNRLPPYFEPMLKKHLEEAVRQSDVVHVHAALTLLNVTAFKAAHRHHKPFVYSPHGALCRTRLTPLAKSTFLHFFEKPLLGRLTAAIATSLKEKADLMLQGCAQNKIHLVPNAVDIVEPSNFGAPCFRKMFGFDSNTLLVLYLARVTKIKGLDLLLEAIQIISRVHNIPVQLAVCGSEGDFSKRARFLTDKLGITDIVGFTGHIDGEIKQAAFRESDVLALTSYSEGLPLSVLEACGNGLPVLVTDSCNLPEVEEYKAGKVTQTDVHRIAKDLGEMLSSATQRVKMGENARIMVRDRFSIPSFSVKMEKVYQGLLTLR